METINFDYNKLQSLKKEYQRAIKDKKEIFMFDGKEILVAYAKYMIEFLESRLNNSALN